ncbi:hypothetical protein N7G274_004582 [Stereocaulon virgatum]|uniref:Uncharacterized protein n=1 Tax=Stereocaulon virgatum TaxID=373712 RepID=A0ABR4AAB2_9LECA
MHIRLRPLNLSLPFLVVLLALSLITTITLAAPTAIPAADTNNDLAVPEGTTHAARSVSEIIAVRKAAEKRAERERGREGKVGMGIW